MLIIDSCSFIFKQFIQRVGFSQGTVLFIQVVKGQPTEQQGKHRFCLHFKSIRTELHVNAAGIPEKCIFMHQLIERSLDKDLDVEFRTLLIELVIDDLTYFQSPVVNRCANIKRMQGFRMEPVACAMILGE